MRHNSRNWQFAWDLKFQPHDNFISFKETFINVKNLVHKSENKVILYNNKTQLNTIVYFIVLY